MTYHEGSSVSPGFSEEPRHRFDRLYDKAVLMDIGDGHPPPVDGGRTSPLPFILKDSVSVGSLSMERISAGRGGLRQTIYLEAALTGSEKDRGAPVRENTDLVTIFHVAEARTVGASLDDTSAPAATMYSSRMVKLFPSDFSDYQGDPLDILKSKPNQSENPFGHKAQANFISALNIAHAIISP